MAQNTWDGWGVMQGEALKVLDAEVHSGQPDTITWVNLGKLLHKFHHALAIKDTGSIESMTKGQRNNKRKNGNLHVCQIRHIDQIGISEK
jgi:hypothetical protein